MEQHFDHQAGLAFLKMHGLGNDFVVVDSRGRDNPVNAALARLIGDRRRGVGFDQLVVILDAAEVAAELVFYNADGSTAGACGNATRCVARLLMDESGLNALTLRTERGNLACLDAGNGLVRVNMGAPRLDWRDIPLARAMETDHLPLTGDPIATNMGNPHCSFFVPDLSAVDLARIGAATETDPLFPERTNVQLAQVLDPENIEVRVWERGVGRTLASGSSACAVTVAAARRGLTGRAVNIHLEGGVLAIDWREDGVWMTGATMLVASGTLSPAFLAQAR